MKHPFFLSLVWKWVWLQDSNLFPAKDRPVKNSKIDPLEQ